jgi:carbonic anhydrase
VIKGVNSLKRMSNVNEAMKDRGLEVHGWIYNVADGRLKPLEIPEDADMSYYKLE